MHYSEILKMALSASTSARAPKGTLRRTIPDTQYRSAQVTGDTLIGQFEMIRTKDGERIFVGEEGQYIRRS